MQTIFGEDYLTAFSTSQKNKIFPTSSLVAITFDITKSLSGLFAIFSNFF